MIKIGDTVIQRVSNIRKVGQADIDIIKKSDDVRLLFWGGRSHTVTFEDFGKGAAALKTSTQKKGNFQFIRSADVPGSVSICKIEIKTNAAIDSTAAETSFTVEYTLGKSGVPSTYVTITKGAGLQTTITVKAGRIEKEYYGSLLTPVTVWSYFTVNTGIENDEGHFYVKSSGPSASGTLITTSHYTDTLQNFLNSDNIHDNYPVLRINNFTETFTDTSSFRPKINIALGAAGYNLSASGAEFRQTNYPATDFPIHIAAASVTEDIMQYPSF